MQKHAGYHLPQKNDNQAGIVPKAVAVSF